MRPETPDCEVLNIQHRPGRLALGVMGTRADDTQAAVTLRFENFRAFLDSFSPNVSQSGMFVEAAEPQAPGTEIGFDLGLDAGDSLIRGRGEVTWVSEDGDSGAAGMGIRFLELDPESEGLIDRIVEIRTKGGREIFDIERQSKPKTPSAAAEAATTDLLRAQLESLKREQAVARERWQSELETVTEARDKLAERLRELEESQRQDRPRLEKLDSDRAELEQKLEQQAEEIDRQSEHSIRVSAQRDRLESEARALRQELEGSKTKNALLEVQVEEQAADISRWLEQGKYATAERDKLETAKKALAEELEAARAEVARLESEGAGLRESAGQLEEVMRSLAESKATEAALREDLDDSRSNLGRIEEQAREIEEQAREKESLLRSELAASEQSRVELCHGLERGQSELENVRQQFDESATRVLELEREASSLESRLADSRERVESLEGETATIHAEMEELRRQRDAMEQQLIAQKKVAKRAKKLSQRVRAEHVRLQEDFAEVQAALEEVQEEKLHGEAAREEAIATIGWVGGSLEDDPASVMAAAAIGADAENHVEADAEGNVEAEAGAEIEVEAGAEVEAEADAESEIEAEAGAEIDAEANTEVEAETHADSDIEAEADVEVDIGAEVEAAFDLGADAVVNAEAGMPTEEVPEELLEEPRESGLWATLTRPLGKLLGEEQGRVEDDPLVAEEESSEAVAEEGAFGGRSGDSEGSAAEPEAPLEPESASKDQVA